MFSDEGKPSLWWSIRKRLCVTSNGLRSCWRAVLVRGGVTVEAGTDSVSGVALGRAQAFGGGWGEAPARRLGTRWTHPAIRAAPGEGRGGAQGVSAEGHTHCCRTAGRVLTLRLMTTQRWRQARRPTLGERWEQDHCGCSVLTNTGAAWVSRASQKLPQCADDRGQSRLMPGGGCV